MKFRRSDTRSEEPVRLAGFAGLLGVLLVALVVLGDRPSVGADDLLVNAGFEAVENGLPIGWIGTYQSPAVTTTARSGLHALALTVPLAPGTVEARQTVSFTNPATTTLTLWIRHGGGVVASSSVRLQFVFPDGATTADFGDTVVQLPVDSWLTRTVTAVAPPGVSAVRVKIQAQLDSVGATLLADDVQLAVVQGTPLEPPTGTPSATGSPAPSSTSIAPTPASATGTPSPIPPLAGLTSTPPIGPTSTATETPPQVPPRVLISEVMPDPFGSPEAGREWVELANPGATTVTLIDCRLEDNGASTTIPGSRTLAPGERLVIGGAAFHAEYPGIAAILVTRIGDGLRNAGDRVVLRCQGTVLDAMSYGDDQSVFSPSLPVAPTGWSYERRPELPDTDRADDFVLTERPSPGTAPIASGKRHYLPAIYRTAT